MERFSWGDIMDIIKKIDVMVEGKLRGFKNKKFLGLEIEDMEMFVEKADSNKFKKIINRYLDVVDPKGKMNVVDAVLKLSDRDALALYDELSDLRYYEEEPQVR
jgi:hypothetical protein